MFYHRILTLLVSVMMSEVLCQEHEDHEHHEPHGDDHGLGDHDDGVVPDPAVATPAAAGRRGPHPVGEGPASTIVNYRGTHFILPTGCHLPKCEGGGSSYTFCRQDQRVLEKKYDDCLA